MNSFSIFKISRSKARQYIEEYYANNYSSGSVDEELETVGLFVAGEAEGRVLDCGCGPVPQLWTIFMPKGVEFYAVDFPQESIDFVKEKIATVGQWWETFLPYQSTLEKRFGIQPKDYIHQQVGKIKEVRQVDMTVALPYPDNFFDTAISFYSLGCLKNEDELLRALRNIQKALKPGGKILHVNTDGENSNDLLPPYTWQGLDQTPLTIRKAFEKIGFQDIFEKQIELTNRTRTNKMYKYSKIHLMKATKK